jgi:hypothetical protein
MDYHVITPETVELVMQVIDGQLVIAPPAVTTQATPSPDVAHEDE